VNVRLSAPVDGFRLAYADTGSGDPVVLLHGWPGDRSDFHAVVAALDGRVRAIVPDLRGFGDSDRHPEDPRTAYSAAAQVASILGLLDELGIERAVFGGYDIGSRLIQLLLTEAPDRVAAAVLTPPLPGAGERLLDPGVQSEYWYQALHRLPLADELLDGRRDALGPYLRHIWTHWAGPTPAIDDAELEALIDRYARPAAFTASIGWYRSRIGSAGSARSEAPPAERVAHPVTVLWPEADPLFPRAWADRLGEWYADLRVVPVGGGHFVPRQAADEFAAALLAHTDPRDA
jgi:Predicted hydrolases or acyltransferases (alpha/beta hydrolase superfamily)